jgi:hypothetical protein
MRQLYSTKCNHFSSYLGILVHSWAFIHDSMMRRGCWKRGASKFLFVVVALSVQSAHWLYVTFSRVGSRKGSGWMRPSRVTRLGRWSSCCQHVEIKIWCKNMVYGLRSTSPCLHSLLVIFTFAYDHAWSGFWCSICPYCLSYSSPYLEIRSVALWSWMRVWFLTRSRRPVRSLQISIWNTSYWTSSARYAFNWVADDLVISNDGLHFDRILHYTTILWTSIWTISPGCWKITTNWIRLMRLVSWFHHSGPFP